MAASKPVTYGIRNRGISKSIRFGATMVMISPYSPAMKTPGETIEKMEPKEYFGSASEFQKVKKNVKVKCLEYKGSLKDTLNKWNKILQSSISYKVILI